MANRTLARVGIEETLCAMLKTHGVTTCGELLRMSLLNLMTLCNLSFQQAITLQETVSEKIAPAPITALAFLQERQKQSHFLSTGFQPLDAAMKGGLLLNAITDLCGAPGIGKTQFCLTCVVQHITETARSGMGQTTGRTSSSSVIYIDAELKLDPKRIVEIAVTRFPTIYLQERNISAPHHIDDLLERITIFRPNTAAELERIFSELQSLVIKSNVKLIIIDSIAAIVRKESWDEREKEAFLISQSQFLKVTAEQCNCAILATNQITPATVRSVEMQIEKIYHEGNEYFPTLGRTWYHCVNTRLTMTSPQPLANPFLVRSIPAVITVQKSPLVPRSSIPYTVEAQGIVPAQETMEL